MTLQPDWAGPFFAADTARFGERPDTYRQAVGPGPNKRNGNHSQEQP